MPLFCLIYLSTSNNNSPRSRLSLIFCAYNFIIAIMCLQSNCAYRSKWSGLFQDLPVCFPTPGTSLIHWWPPHENLSLIWVTESFVNPSLTNMIMLIYRGMSIRFMVTPLLRLGFMNTFLLSNGSFLSNLCQLTQPCHTRFISKGSTWV